MRDGEIRHALIASLGREHAHEPDVRIWPEMSVGLGASRVDVGLINGAISGYEIKSDRDTLSRLPSQVEHYDRCLDFASVVVTERYERRIRDHVPRWWGIMVARADAGGDIHVIKKRSARRNPKRQGFYVAQLLWRDEAFAVLRDRGLHRGLAKATRWDLWDALANQVPLDELSVEVRKRLTERPPYESA